MNKFLTADIKFIRLMERINITKKKYAKPSIWLEEVSVEPLLAGSNKTLPFDQGDYTNDALSGECGMWDDFDQSDSPGLWADSGESY